MVKNLTKWVIEEDNDGHYVSGTLMDNKEAKDWETSHLTKLVMHRAYAEAITDSGTTYILEYKNAAPGGHTVHCYVGSG